MYKCTKCNGIQPIKPTIYKKYNLTTSCYFCKQEIEVKSSSKKTIPVKRIDILTFENISNIPDDKIQEFIVGFRSLSTYKKLIFCENTYSYGIAELTLTNDSKCKAYMKNKEMIRIASESNGEINDDMNILIIYY